MGINNQKTERNNVSEHIEKKIRLFLWDCNYKHLFLIIHDDHIILNKI